MSLRPPLHLNYYPFHACWSVAAPAEAVWRLVSDPCSYPAWWRQYPHARRMNGLRGIGAQWEVDVRFAAELPYLLHCTMELTRLEEPHVVEWQASGDLYGRVSFFLEEIGSGTRVTYDAATHTGTLLLNAAAPLARPLFARNQASMMNRAEEDLRAALARGCTHSARVRQHQNQIRIVPAGEGQVLAASSGAVVTMKASAENTNGAYSLFEVLDVPQEWSPLQRLDQTDIAGYILEGEYVFQVGERSMAAPAGSAIYIPAGTDRRWKSVGSTPGRMILIAAGTGAETDLEDALRSPMPKEAGNGMRLAPNHGVELILPPSREGRRAAPARNGEVGRRASSVPAGAGKSSWALGGLMTFKMVGVDTLGAFSLFENRDVSHGGAPFHVHHREDEGFYILDGSYEFQIGDRTIAATAGAFIYAPVDIRHNYLNVGADGGGYLVITSPAGFEYFVEDLDQTGPPRSSPAVPPGFMERLAAVAPRHGIELLGMPATDAAARAQGGGQWF